MSLNDDCIFCSACLRNAFRFGQSCHHVLQLLRIDWFGHVVIEARSEGAIPIFLLTKPGHGNHKSLREIRLLPKTPRNLKSIESRQSEIHKDGG